MADLTSPLSLPPQLPSQEPLPPSSWRHRLGTALRWLVVAAVVLLLSAALSAAATALLYPRTPHSSPSSSLVPSTPPSLHPNPLPHPLPPTTPQPPPPPTSPVVHLTSGALRGRLLTPSAPSPTYFFGAIPFAQPPLGPLRWRDPVTPPTPWTGTRDASTYAPVCYQFDGGDHGSGRGDEDCLYLNVFTRNLNASHAMPVMVYIHGGSSINGDSRADMQRLVVSRNVVVVTVAYRSQRLPTLSCIRLISLFVATPLLTPVHCPSCCPLRLNVFGYLALDLLSDATYNRTGRRVSGNYGISDNIAALHWVRDNVHAFGGDPARVTIFGQSTGGTNVLAVLISPLSLGLFHSAISWSGSPVLQGTLAQASRANAVYLDNSNCTGWVGEAQLRCLLGLTAEQALQAGPWWTGAHWGGSSDFAFPSFLVPDAAVIIVDGWVVREELNAALAHSPAEVSLLYTHMRTEIDGGPTDVRAYRNQSAFAAWLRQDILDRGWNETVAEAVIAEYPISEQSGDPQLTYELIVNDITYCGGVGNVQSASQAKGLRVYHGLNAAHPVPPVALGGPGGWVTHWSPHGWDMAVFCDTMSGYHEVTAEDRRLQELLRVMWVDQLGGEGRAIDEQLWPRVDAGSARVTSVVLDQEVPLPTVVEGLRADQCRFWNQLGFSRRGWAN